MVPAISDLLADLEDERLSVVFCATSEVPGASQGTMALKRINKELQVPTLRQLLEIRTSNLQNKTRAKEALGPEARRWTRRRASNRCRRLGATYTRDWHAVLAAACLDWRGPPGIGPEALLKKWPPVPPARRRRGPGRLPTHAPN